MLHRAILWLHRWTPFGALWLSRLVSGSHVSQYPSGVGNVLLMNRMHSGFGAPDADSPFPTLDEPAYIESYDSLLKLRAGRRLN